LMVFLIQRAQNKDALAIHLKLNEIVAAIEGASNRLINIEDLTETEVHTLHDHYRTLAQIAKTEAALTHSHSIEEAHRRHAVKRRRRRERGQGSTLAPGAAGETAPAPSPATSGASAPGTS